MLKRLFRIFLLLPIMVIGSAYAITCQSNEFEYNGECIENKFQITTTNDTNSFVFTMSAKGTFYIDWGDGNVEMINRTGTTKTEYSHNYASANEYIIKFGGRATGYSTARTASSGSAVAFGLFRDATKVVASTNNTYDKIAGISGSLGAVFPTIGTGTTTSTQPAFINTFDGCSNLTGSIPADLFTGVVGKPTNYMFYGTFYGCTGLTNTDIDDTYNSGKKYAIPPTLFAGISGVPAANMFFMTFRGCTGLTGTIPKDLFVTISGIPASYMFYGTFWSCQNLTGSIPADLFKNISGAPATSMFQYTFDSCSGLSGTNIDDPNNSGMKYAIPPNLFAGISGKPASAMFAATFSNSPGLTGSIPGSLFGGISGGPATYMFNNTFYGCRGLTGTIPAGLFSGISGKPALYMFYQTFYSCIGLTGSIPGTLFSGVSGAPANSMFYQTFYGCSGLMGTDIDDPNNPGMKYAIPPTLFSGISGAPATNMFLGTFHNCSKLAGTIPETLFSGIFGTPIPSMFQELFRNDVALTGSIPGTLFSGISGKPARSMFNSTFSGCQNLTGTIPSNLFSGISGAPASQMFYYTFLNCKKITGSIPGDLFSGIIGHTTTDAFVGTFSGCNNLGKEIIGGTSAYYVPPELFAGIDKTSVTSGMMTGIFQNTGLLTACPTGTSQYTTGFESYWNNKKSCTACPVEYPLYDSTNDTCYAQVTFIDSDDNTLLKKEDVYYDGNNGSGYNLPSYSPVKPDTILTNWENGSGTIIAANDVLTGNQVVYSDWGFHCDSGHYFHVGNEQICAAETKRTEHAMVIQFDPEHTYYIHATPNSEHDYTINSSSIHKMKANYNGTIYNLHDASVYFDN